MITRIVWSAVASVILGIGAIVAAIVGDQSDLTIALGAAAIVAAVLSARER